MYTEKTSSFSSSVGVAADSRLSASASCLLDTCVLLVAPCFLGRFLGVRQIVVPGVAFALARGHHSDFVGPVLAVRALQLDALGAGMGRNAAVVGCVAAPPLAPEDGVGH